MSTCPACYSPTYHPGRLCVACTIQCPWPRAGSDELLGLRLELELAAARKAAGR